MNMKLGANRDRADRRAGERRGSAWPPLHLTLARGVAAVSGPRRAPGRPAPTETHGASPQDRGSPGRRDPTADETSRPGWARSGWPSRRPHAACSACRTPATPPGYGGLVRPHRCPALASPRPYGGYFDEVADALGRALEAAGAGFADAIERVVVDRGELTFYVRREHLLDGGRRRCATTRRCASSCAPASPACTTRDDDRPRAARRLPPALDHPQPPDPARGRPCPTPTRTSRRWSASTRPTTGTSARPRTCSASSSTATRR